MHYVSTISYFILLNSLPGDFFRPQRGLRQGDPYSPYLFVICIEGLSSLVYQIERRHLFFGLHVCKAAPMCNLLYFLRMIALFSLKLLWMIARKFYRCYGV